MEMVEVEALVTLWATELWNINIGCIWLMVEWGFHGGDEMDFIERKGGRISWMAILGLFLHDKFTFTLTRQRLINNDIFLLLVLDCEVSHASFECNSAITWSRFSCHPYWKQVDSCSFKWPWNFWKEVYPMRQEASYWFEYIGKYPVLFLWVSWVWNHVSVSQLCAWYFLLLFCPNILQFLFTSCFCLEIYMLLSSGS